MMAGIESGRATIWRSSGAAEQRAGPGVQGRVEREPQHEVDEERRRSGPGDRPASDVAAVGSSPSSMLPSWPEATTIISAGRRISDTWVSPARPMPAILPTTSCGAVAAEISSSMTRLAFSATIPDATHSP